MSPATALAPIPPPPGATSSEADLIRLALAVVSDLMAACRPGVSRDELIRLSESARDHLIGLAEIRAAIANRDATVRAFAGATACGHDYDPAVLWGWSGTLSPVYAPTCGDDAALDERPARLFPLGGEALGCSIRGREPREASVALDGHPTDGTGMQDEEGQGYAARPVEMGAAWSWGDARPVRPGVATLFGHPLADVRYRPVIGPGMAADAACGEPAGYGMPPVETGGELDGEV